MRGKRLRRAAQATGARALPVPLRIAVVGCGAIARAFHLPALVSTPGVRDYLIVVDRDLTRAEAVRAQFSTRGAVADHRQVLNDVDGAIVAVPPEFHTDVVRDFLRAGVPVLCEKPLATTLEEASSLVHEAETAGAVLAVNNTHRLYPALRATWERIRSGRLGRVRRIEVYEGDRLVGWPLAGGTAFGRAGTGRGALQDVGAHALDVLCWWLGERPRITRYLDDALGGSEAVARVEFAGAGYDGVVHVTWLSKLSNTFRVAGEEETVEGELRAWDVIQVTGKDGRCKKVGLRPDVRSFSRVGAHVIATFLGAIRGECQPAVLARDVLPSIAMIEECYSRRERFPMPWHHTMDKAFDVVV